MLERELGVGKHGQFLKSYLRNGSEITRDTCINRIYWQLLRHSKSRSHARRGSKLRRKQRSTNDQEQALVSNIDDETWIDIVGEIMATADREEIHNHSAVLARAVEKARKRVYPDGGEHAGKHSIDVHADSW